MGDSLVTQLRRGGLIARRAGLAYLSKINGTRPTGRRAEVTSEEFTTAFGDALKTLPKSLVADCAVEHMPANRAPWFDTGITLTAGDKVSWFAAGRVELSGLLDIFIEPHFQLWARVGDGPVFRSTRAGFTFVADRDGRLELASYFPGEWANESGDLAAVDGVYDGISGGMDVAIVRWAGDVDDGLAQLDALDPTGLVSEEIDRRANAKDEPEGWKHLWFLGPSEIYEQRRLDGREVMACRTHCDVGILRKDVDVPLERDTTLEWSWNVDTLPSALAEDTLPTHDYLSIAVEFENGIDVTYYWSAALGVSTGYWCPLPNWEKREYHIVVRSGTDGLGAWHDEERNLYVDYRRYVGEPPSRIVRVWFISNSLFQRQHGACAYSDVSVGTRGNRVKVV